ncbi:hypothetical protein ACQKP0_14805 [Heyndrickxia sp. NPDC080065]|uniref:hypothetical protein n=1 Tax=Heyndrickxia sp. NPDC080065 TaxID=3390568 RepID=UPI003CFE68C9
MKHEYFFAFLAFFLMSLSTVAITYAGETAAIKEKIIQEYNVDVTGDQKPEKIVLKGIQVDPTSMYMKKVWAEITSSTNGKFQIDYELGYEPKIEFVDLNHDGVADLLESSATGGSGGLYNYHLSTLKDGKGLEIPLPPSLNIQGQFKDNYKAKITIPETKYTKVIDLSSRKKDYIRLGLYQENGKLNEPTELMIDPVAMYKVVKVQGREGYGLNAFRQISGASHADILGTVSSVWYYNNGSWQLINVKFQ